MRLKNILMTDKDMERQERRKNKKDAVKRRIKNSKDKLKDWAFKNMIKKSKEV